MKLPVWPKDDRDIIDEDGAFVCSANTTADRDYIIKTLNSHEKYKKTLQTLRDECDDNNHNKHHKEFHRMCKICVIDQALKEKQ